MTASGAVLYDYLLVRGGAERVSLLLAEAFSADLCVGFCCRSQFSEQAINQHRLIDLGISTRIRPLRYLSVTHAFATRTAFLRRYAWVLHSGVCAPVAVRHCPTAHNVYYCHALPSFAYELKSYYLRQLAPPLRPALHALAAWLRPRYEAALQRMDIIVANSCYTQSLLKHYLGLDARVIYPPVETNRFCWQGQDNYYLSTARLEPHKRIDVIVDAFKHMPDRQLIVAGGGSAAAALQQRAGGATNIRFTGWVDQSTMQTLLGNCIASVYLGMKEPFGMSPVESMAAGKPVIGTTDGGMTETVVHNRTGLLIDGRPGPDAVADCVKQLSPKRARSMRAACEIQAGTFSRQRFLDQMRLTLER